MGVVYRAEDLRLHRPVALKFLPGESISEQDKQRFLNEARAAAAVRHPNICAIYDIDEDAGQLFIAMAYLDGQTLARKISAGPLPIEEAVAIAIQIANGLQAAHDIGIVHRDIKSSNVMVDDGGRVSVMDFGLALRPDTTRLTVEGGTVGTPSYMSPEQVTGGAIDSRTDIWSLGVLLFEMLAGRVPFRREHAGAMAHAILNDEAPNLHGLRPAVSPELAAIVAKAVAKRPQDRWQSCRQFAAELRLFAGSAAGMSPSMSDVTQTVAFARAQQKAPASPKSKSNWIWLLVAGAVVLSVVFFGAYKWYSGRKSVVTGEAVAVQSGPVSGEGQVAILPFAVGGGSASGDATRSVADGFVDVMTSALTEITAGKYLVVPAEEIRRRKIANPQDARRTYGVNVAITGDAKSAGGSDGKVDFVIRIVDTATGHQSADESFVFDPADPISSRDRAVSSISKLLHLDLTPTSQTTVRAGDSTAPAAYSLYLQARGLLGRYDVSGNVDKAMVLLRQAVREDPKYALAWAALGEAAYRKARATGDKKWSLEAVTNAEHAVQLDPSLSIVHTVLGTVYSSAAREEDAIRELQAAIAISPSNAEAPRELARLYSNMGRFDQARESYRKSTESRPTDWFGHLRFGLFYYEWGQYAEAEEELNKAAMLTPDNDVVYRNLGGILTMQGRYREAVIQYQKALRIKSDPTIYGGMGAALFYQHLYAEAVAALEAAIDLDSSNADVWGNLGIYYKWLPGSGQKSTIALKRALDLTVKYLAAMPSNYETRASLAEYRARLGDKAGAVSEISKIPEAARKARTSRIALVYELTGQRAEAVRAIESGLTTAASLNQIRDDPDLQALWNSPEMQRVAKAIASRSSSTPTRQ